MRARNPVRITAIALSCVLSLAADRKISATNVSEYSSNQRWQWTVFLNAAPDVISHVKCVQYTLHPTYPNPVRLVCEKGTDAQPFSLKADGWGEFKIPITVMFDDGTRQEFIYDLKLKAPKEVAEGIQKGTAQSACGTQIDAFTLKDKEVHQLPAPYAAIYICADHIYGRIGSAFVDIIQTDEAIPREDYSWKRIHNRFPHIKEILRGALSLEEARRGIDLSAKRPQTLSIIRAPALSLFLQKLDDPKMVTITACAP